MRKVVFDTNVYISAFITPGGKAQQTWLKALEGQCEVWTSTAVLTEMAGKLRGKFYWQDEPIKATIWHITQTAKVVKPAITPDILKDAPDNRILECAQEAGVEIIVTGDKHLLDLGVFAGIRIIRIAEFLAESQLRLQQAIIE